jgi:hypothetical protein
MRFPLSNRLALPCTFERYLPGRPHPDGRRYLPTLLFRLDTQPAGGTQQAAVAATPPGLLLAVVDRHHVVDLEAVGQRGLARLVFMLGEVRAQQPPLRQGLLPEPGWQAERASARPRSFGPATHVPAWETEQRHLPYASLYTELLLDIGVGTIGVRTSATAGDLGALVGKPRVEPGDWVEVGPSRVDILGFTPA